MANAWESAPVVSSGGWQDAPLVKGETVAPKSGWDQFVEGVKNPVGKDLVMGAVRGAAGIGATIMQPFQALEDKLTGKTDRTLSSLVTGQAPQSSNQETRAGVEGGLSALGADPSSMAFQTGKLGAEIAGTAGVGGALAAPLRGIAPGFANALASSGMQAGTVAPNAVARAANMGARVVGGGVTGAASAGLVDPSSAAAGGVIGAALPPVLRVAGATGQAAGRVLRGPEQAPEVAATVQAARDAGYVIPPTQARPTLANRLMEGAAGKITTAQNASARNQGVTNRLVAQELGLPADTVLTQDVLNNVRRQAGQAYQAIGQTGVITPGPAYDQALDRITAQARTAAAGFPNAQANPIIATVDGLRSQAFDASAAVAQTRNLREMADVAFRGGDRSASRSLREASDAIEDALEVHLTQTGNPQLLQDFRAARARIAQTYTVQKALVNPTSGNVDARKLAAELKKERPLTGGMRDAAEFAGRFPKAAQTPEMMGSLPGTSPLDWIAGGALSAGLSNPLMLASVAARPGARAAALSPYVQNRLVQPAASGLQFSPELAALMYRGAPVLGADR